MVTVRDLITSSLITSGAIALGEVPDAAEISRGLMKFNDQVALLSLDNLWAYTNTRVDGTTVAGQVLYTVGDDMGDEDFITPRPPEIVTLTLKLANVWYPLRYVSETEFANTVRLEEQINVYVPTLYTYRPSIPNGIIEVYPTPSGAFPLQISTRSMKTEYTLDDELTLPAGYAGYLEYSLASVLGVDYGVDVTEVSQIAAQRKANIQRQNYQPQLLHLPYITKNNKTYDILSDSDTYGRESCLKSHL